MDHSENSEVILVQAIFGEVLAFKGDLITGQLLDYGAHTRCELAFLLRFVDRGDTAIDLGAHIGTFTVPLAKAVGSEGRVIAVEADPRNYDLLVENVRRNGLSGHVRTLNAVAGDSAKTYDFVRYSENSGMSQPVQAAAGQSAAINGIGLNEIALGQERVDIVKIVVQGMELDVLRDAEAVLDGKPLLYVQVHAETLGHFGVSRRQLEDFLRRKNYRFFINVGDRNAAHDNFIIKEIESLEDHGPHINVLAIPADHERLSRAFQA